VVRVLGVWTHGHRRTQGALSQPNKPYATSVSNKRKGDGMVGGRSQGLGAGRSRANSLTEHHQITVAYGPARRRPGTIGASHETLAMGERARARSDRRRRSAAGFALRRLFEPLRLLRADIQGAGKRRPRRTSRETRHQPRPRRHMPFVHNSNRPICDAHHSGWSASR
jgi:hypothetical protein